MIASVWDMPLSTGMDMNWRPVRADTSSSHNSGVSCHRQLECSTGMTEGVSDHTTTSPQLILNPPFPGPLSTLPFPINMPSGWINPPPALIPRSELTGQSRQMARSCLVVKTQQVLCCQKPLHTSSLSHTTATITPPRALATISVGGERGTLQGLLCYQHAPALKWAGPESGLCLLEGISLVVCVSLR